MRHLIQVLCNVSLMDVLKIYNLIIYLVDKNISSTRMSWYFLKINENQYRIIQTMRFHQAMDVIKNLFNIIRSRRKLLCFYFCDLGAITPNQKWKPKNISSCFENSRNAGKFKMVAKNISVISRQWLHRSARPSSISLEIGIMRGSSKKQTTIF
jgi:hypothetical protein